MNWDDFILGFATAALLIELLVTGIDRRDSPSHVKISESWTRDSELEEWEKVDE